ncbi:MAG: ArnT family glycosyltransferase [Candidatus Promineifilaceae bacterium]
MTRPTDSRLPNIEYLILIGLTLIAFALRVYRLDSVPPGLRMDELSNSLVVSQLVLDGQPRFFFAEAEGHEGLWHVLQAGFIAIFGRNFWGFRGISVILGTLTVPLTYLVGKQILDKRLGLLAAACVSVSFWSLMYSRVATRHIAMGIFMLGAFYLFLRGLEIGRKRQAAESNKTPRLNSDLLWAGVITAIGLYTYFAAWVTPVVLGGFSIAGGVLFRPIFLPKWRSLLAMFGIIGLLVLPLINDIRNIPETSEEGRVSVVAQPIHDAREGDFSTIWEHVVITFSMFHQLGDQESLYNVPERPVFSPPLAAIFWIGVLLALYNTFFSGKPAHERAGYLFLIMWLVAGISPAFVSVPPSSYGHSLAAHPAVYLLFALPIVVLSQRLRDTTQPILQTGAILLPLMMLILLARRDFEGYFQVWPTSGTVRFLYHADMNDIGRYLHDHPEITDFGITGTLAGPWERLMLDLVKPDSAEPRWYTSSRAIMLSFGGRSAENFNGFPLGDPVYQEAYLEGTIKTPSAYQRQSIAQLPKTDTPLACFVNGLCIVGVRYETPLLDITWHVAKPLDLPPIAINSFPPVPGAYDGLRLATFAHLWDEQGVPNAVDDGFWVDPVTLQQDDVFRQRHILIPADGSARSIAIGLYDPMTGTRIPTTGASDHLAIPLP